MPSAAPITFQRPHAAIPACVGSLTLRSVVTKRAPLSSSPPDFSSLGSFGVKVMASKRTPGSLYALRRAASVSPFSQGALTIWKTPLSVRSSHARQD
jgi:hypothetical protein